MTTNAGGNDEWVGIDDIVVSSQVSRAEPVDRRTPPSSKAMRGTTPISFTVTRTGATLGRGHRRLHGELRQRAVRRQCRRFRRRPGRSPAWSASPTARPARRSFSTSRATSIPRATRTSPSLCPTRPARTIADGTAHRHDRQRRRPAAPGHDQRRHDRRGQCRHQRDDLHRHPHRRHRRLRRRFRHRRRQRDGRRATMSRPAARSTSRAGETTARPIIGHDQRRHSIPSSARPSRSCSPTRPTTPSSPTAPASARSSTTSRSSSTTSRARPISARSSPARASAASTSPRPPTVTVRAIVTAVDNVGPRQGYYLTEEITDWDGNSFTSEGIFVMTRNDAGVGTVVSGRQRRRPRPAHRPRHGISGVQHDAAHRCWSIPTGLSIISTGNALPTVTLDQHAQRGADRASRPIITDCSDGAGDTFDASLYALSYFETVEGMLVTIPNMVVADGFVSTSGGDPFLQAYSLDQRQSRPDQQPRRLHDRRRSADRPARHAGHRRRHQSWRPAPP